MSEEFTTGRTPQLHFSALEKLWACGVAFERRYIKKDRTGVRSYMHVGSAVDHAANINLQNKIDNQVLLPVAQVVDEARDEVVRRMDEKGLDLEPEEQILGEKVAKANVIDKTVRLAKTHASKVAQRLRPKRVQAPFSLTIKGMPYDIVGTRDLDEIDDRVCDLKTSKRTPPANIADNSDQLTTYALSVAVIEKVPAPIKVGLDYIIDLKGGTRTPPRYTSTRDKSDFQKLMNRIENAAAVLESGSFTPANQGKDWWCSTKYCEFATTCPYFRNPKSVVIDTGN